MSMNGFSKMNSVWEIVNGYVAVDEADRHKEYHSC